MKLPLIIIFSAILIGWSRGAAYSQNVGDIESDIKKTQNEIAQLDKQISQNKILQKDQQQTINLIDQKISARRRIVAELDAQAANLRYEMGAEGRLLAIYNDRLTRLKTVMATLLRQAYKHTFVSKTFPAASINESQKTEILKLQIAYLSVQISKQVASIDSMGRALGSRMEVIKGNHERLNVLHQEKNNEMRQLAIEKKQSASMQQKLQLETGSLENQAAAKRKRIDDLQRQISAAIANDNRPNSAENIALAKLFSQNKGKLPSPVSPAKIIDAYGVHDHPTQKGVKVNNKGVNLQSSAGAIVRAVFKGEVRALFTVQGMGYSAIIRHGDYLTVYSNLETVNIKKGQMVETGATIGKLTDDELHFEVWQETKNINPQLWVKW